MRQAWYCEYIWYDGTDAPECRLDMYDEDGERLPKWRDGGTWVDNAVRPVLK